MYTAIIPTCQYGNITVDYKTIDDIEKLYPEDYLIIKRAQQKAELLVKEAKEKAVPK